MFGQVLNLISGVERAAINARVALTGVGGELGAVTKSLDELAVGADAAFLPGIASRATSLADRAVAADVPSIARTASEQAADGHRLLDDIFAFTDDARAHVDDAQFGTTSAYSQLDDHADTFASPVLDEPWTNPGYDDAFTAYALTDDAFAAPFSGFDDLAF